MRDLGTRLFCMQLNESGMYATYSRCDIQINPETCARSHQTMASSALQEIQFVVPRGENLTYNGDSRAGNLTFENLQMSNFPWVAQLRPPSWGKPLIGAYILARTKTYAS